MENLKDLFDKYYSYGLEKTADYGKFNGYAITLHSTAIEGATLTLIDTQLLIEDGITPKGKPLEHSLMVKDHYNALQYTLAQAKAKPPVTADLIRDINEKVMKSTGGVSNTVLGTVDASKGEYRKMNNFVGNRYFMNYSKVPDAINKLATGINKSMPLYLEQEKALQLSWKAHFDLVSIHTFVDGNGRTARLMENFIQARYNLPLGRVFKEDKGDYYKALEDSRKNESLTPFYDFMSGQYKKHLEIEIEKYKEMDNSKGRGYSFVF